VSASDKVIEKAAAMSLISSSDGALTAMTILLPVAAFNDGFIYAAKFTA
jgi:hypothetical protein